MAKGDKQDVARAKSAATKKVRGGISKANVGKVFPSGPGRSKTTGRSTYVKHSTSVWTPDENRSVNTRKKINKESVKLTPKQMKDARVAKANAANKMKAQGAKINSSATSNYNRRSK